MASVADPLIIPDDVDFSPVSELSDEIRGRLDCAADDVAITRIKSRTPSKVVNADAAALLQECIFRFSTVFPLRMIDEMMACR